MSVSFMPYVDSESPCIPANSDAYVPVRVPAEPPADGYLTVYLPDGTGLVVNSRHLLRLDRDRSGPGASPKGRVEPDAKDLVADNHR